MQGTVFSRAPWNYDEFNFVTLSPYFCQFLIDMLVSNHGDEIVYIEWDFHFKIQLAIYLIYLTFYITPFPPAMVQNHPPVFAHLSSHPTDDVFSLLLLFHNVHSFTFVKSCFNSSQSFERSLTTLFRIFHSPLTIICQDQNMTVGWRVPKYILNVLIYQH